MKENVFIIHIKHLIALSIPLMRKKYLKTILVFSLHRTVNLCFLNFHEHNEYNTCNGYL